MNNPLGVSPSKGKQGTTKKNFFDLGGNRTNDLRIRSTVTLPTAPKNYFDLGGNRTNDLRIRSTVTLPTELWFPVSLY